MADESQHKHQQPLGYTNFSSAADAAMQQRFQPGQDQLYSLQAGMEMMGIAAKAHQSSDAWRAGFFPEAAGSSSNAVPGGESLNENPAYPWLPPPPQTNRMPVVDESVTRFLFPPSVSSSGLSLSLNHAATSNAGAAYEAPSLHHHHQVLPGNNYPRDHVYPLLQFSAIDPYHHELKSSKFLLPARELLNEFCILDAGSSKHKAGKSKQSWEQEGAAPSSSSTCFNQALFSLDIHELQGRKAKLLAMLEEVDRRYRRYREQMRAVVLSFEAAAGEGAAAAYASLASKVMSRHFRCLRDGIVLQIHVIKKAVGEKDTIAPGTTRGETPRLKLIDQHLRQQRTFQQAGVMESHPWRPQRGLPERSVSILRAWLFEHFLHPYPSDVDKHILARQTGLSRSQVSNWFINARVRLWKPMVEEMYLEEKKEQENNQTSSQEENDNSNKLIIYDDPRHIDIAMEDEKPAVAGQLLPDPDSLSWVINNPHARHRMASSSSGGKSSQLNPNSGENFGVIDLDFASYNQQCGGSRQNFGSGVSLTLGLQQHDGGGGGGGGGVSLSFSPPASHHPPPLLFSRTEEMVDHPGQFTVLDGDQQAQNVAYRNLMGAQLLRDLAG